MKKAVLSLIFAIFLVFPWNNALAKDEQVLSTKIYFWDFQAFGPIYYGFDPENQTKSGYTALVDHYAFNEKNQVLTLVLDGSTTVAPHVLNLRPKSMKLEVVIDLRNWGYFMVVEAVREGSEIRYYKTFYGRAFIMNGRRVFVKLIPRRRID